VRSIKKIDRRYFYRNFAFRPLSQKQVDAINFLLDRLDGSELLMYLSEYAYVLATIKHETAETYLPIAEYGKGKGRIYGKPDPVTGKTYYGRGYVQLTWKFNYEKMGKLLGIDLVNKPELAMERETAWKITELGMVKGLFTGKKLSDYITAYKRDFYNARKIINGLDRAGIITGYATGFREALKWM
jgi:glycosyl hydrolase family 19 (putative chitinase)